LGNTGWRSDLREYGGQRTASFSTFQGADFNANASVTAGSSSSKVILDNAIGVRLYGIDAWDDLRFPVSSVQINKAISKPDQIKLLGNVHALGFDNTATEAVSFWCQMPHDWRDGTAVHAHVHWAPSGTATGNVCWELEYYIAGINATFTSLATLSATDYNDGTANLHRYCDLGSINMTKAEGGVSAMIGCRLIRRADLAKDNYGEDAALVEIDFHYRKDGFGSDGEASKSY